MKPARVGKVPVVLRMVAIPDAAGSAPIENGNDLQTELTMLVVGILVSELAVRGRRYRATAQRSSGDIARIHSVAELVADGSEPSFVILVVCDHLRELLHLRACGYELAAGRGPVARLERSGDVTVGAVRWGVHSMGLPTSAVQLQVQVKGRVVGRFVMTPSPGVPVDFDSRIVAVALADQAGAALAGAATAAA
jgi:hypothetical protein